MTPHTTLDASAADLRGMQDNQTYYLAGTQTTLGNPIVVQGATGAVLCHPVPGFRGTFSGDTFTPEF